MHTQEVVVSNIEARFFQRFPLVPPRHKSKNKCELPKSIDTSYTPRKRCVPEQVKSFAVNLSHTALDEEHMRSFEANHQNKALFHVATMQPAVSYLRGASCSVSVSLLLSRSMRASCSLSILKRDWY